ncbi:MAG: hypothetical protein HOC71_00405 [Candidatus Latescibacteria bacterium]|jgi:long-chain fatty acid transport protein|nr:hypothetical protein [Candidatus Latescibacterota bacterium]
MKKLFLLTLVIGSISAISTHTALATNGMNMIGYGARMAGMAGASFGISGDTNLMNTNPAGITTIPGRRVDGGIGLLFPAVKFKNGLNDLDANSAVFPLPSIGFVSNNSDSPWSFGVGMYAQGGMGATYDGVSHSLFKTYDNTPLTTDSYVGQEYHSNIAYMKLAPTVAYELLPNLSAGVSLNLGYAMMEMKMPYSMSPSAMQGQIPGMNGMTFGQMFGSPMDQGGLGYDEVTALADMSDGVTATGYGFKLGMQYQPVEKLTFGFSYTNKATLDFSGDAEMDMTSQFGDAYDKMVMGALVQGAANPMNPTSAELNAAHQGVGVQLAGMGIDMSKGMAAIYDVDIEFSWPQEFGFGAAYVATDRLTVAADVRWINWKDSMEKFVMKLSGGANPNINAMMGTQNGNMQIEMPLNWDDQIVLAIGAEYLATDVFAIRAGFNIGNNPVPAETVIPIFPAIVENHITLGAGYKISDNVSIDAAYELVVSNSLDVNKSIIANEYDGSTSQLGENILHVSVGYEF